MIIKSFRTNTELESGEYKDCGILFYKRHIFLFVDPLEYNNNSVKQAKAVIINESVSKGTKEGTIMHITIDNSVIVRTSVYFCNAVFEISNKIELSQFFVNSAYTKESQTVFDKNEVIQYFPGHYSVVLENLNCGGMSEIYDEITSSFESTVLPPTYYSELQQYRETCDIYNCGGAMMEEIYSGKELIDNKTSINVLDINIWDTMRISLLGFMQKMKDEIHGTFDLAELIHGSFVNFVGDNTYFIYDSDGNGLNKPGVNLVEGKVPLAEWYTHKHISENVDTALKLFEQSCRELENQHGHIKVHCYTSKIGDKIKIKFKDYISNPKHLNPMGESAPDGDKSSIDTGYYIDKAIMDTVDQLSEDLYSHSEYYE
jgi:hypothetical protein